MHVMGDAGWEGPGMGLAFGARAFVRGAFVRDATAFVRDARTRAGEFAFEMNAVAFRLDAENKHMKR